MLNKPSNINVMGAPNWRMGPFERAISHRKERKENCLWMLCNLADCEQM